MKQRLAFTLMPMHAIRLLQRPREQARHKARRRSSPTIAPAPDRRPRALVDPLRVDVCDRCAQMASVMPRSARQRLLVAASDARLSSCLGRLFVRVLMVTGPRL